MHGLKHIAGLALVVAIAALGYLAWGEVGGWPRMITQDPVRPFAEGLGVSIETLRLARTTLTELRLVLEVLAAFLALSLLDWLWRRIVGES